MTVIVTKTFSTTCPGELQDSISANVTITTDLEQIVYEGGADTDFYFASALSGPEDTELDSILSGWACTPIPAETDETVDDTAAASPDVLWSSEKITDDFVNIDGDEIVDGRKTFTGNTRIGGNAASPYVLSLQSSVASTWLEIQNSGGAGQGVFFGVSGNDFQQWNYQGGGIDFYTSPTPSGGVSRFTISNQGDVSVKTLAGVGPIQIGTFGVGGVMGRGASVEHLDDVTNVTPSDKQVLIYDGVTDNKYENRLLVEDDISDLQSYILATDVTYEQLDANGDVGTTAGTLASGDHLHSTVYQPLDTDLTNIAALTGTSGFLKTDGANVWTVDTNTYLTDITGEDIATLNDVVITTPIEGNLLTYDDGTDTWINQTPAAAGLSEQGHRHTTTDVDVGIVTGATYTTLTDQFATIGSSGVVDGGTCTFIGGGDVTVSAGSGLIRLANVHTDPILNISWDADTLSSFPVNVDSFIYVYVNAGVATLAHTTTSPVEQDPDQSKIYLASVYHESVSGIHFVNNTLAEYINDSTAHTIARFNMTDPFSHVSGAAISETGTRNLSVTDGNFWEGLNFFTTSGIDTSVADTFATFYRDGVGGWTLTFSETAFSNSLYDDGSGTLASLTSGNYGIHWVYLDVSGATFLQYGLGDYATLTAAQDASAPSVTHPAVEFHAKLIGRIIILQGASSATQIDTVFATSFATSSATDHNDLLNKGTNSHATIDSHLANTSIHFTDAPSDGTEYVRKDAAWVNPTTGAGSQGEIYDTIWAEENSTLANGQREWSFGNGSTGVNNVYAMYDCTITKMFVDAESPGTTVTIDVMINDVVAGTGTFSANGVYTFPSAITVNSGDAIGFQTNTVSGTWTDVRTGVLLVSTIEGLKGDTGDAGLGVPAGGTAGQHLVKIDGTDNNTEWVTPAAGLSVEEEGTPVGTTFDTMNFVGDDVTVTDVAGTATITIAGNNFVKSISGNISAQSGTSSIPYDNSTPQITEGTQMGAAPITLADAANTVVVEFTCIVGTSNRGAHVMVAVFRDSTCIGTFVATPTTGGGGGGGNDGNQVMTAKIIDMPATASQVTYSGRIGVTSGTWYLNTPIGSANFGGTIVDGSFFSLTETKS